MEKKLRLIRSKLDRQPIFTLSAEEIRLYFEYRLGNIIAKKKVITRNELEYLFGETGPGNLRIDPDLQRIVCNGREHL